MIGHLPNETSATTFSDFLYVEGISNLVEAEKEGWAVWIHSEDQLEKARTLLRNYLGNPSDAKYNQNSQRANELKQEEQQRQEEAQKRVYDRTRIFRSFLPQRIGPLTLLLILICVAVGIWSRLGTDGRALAPLLISKFARGLPEIQQGEIWRVVTPILIHFGPLHLIFNLLWLADLGSMIESNKGTGRFALLMLVIAATSNVAQWYMAGPIFGGMSGVVYGLLGYAWVMGKFAPASGLFVHPQTMMMMIVWLFLCMTPVIPHVANTAHVVGLAVGAALGFLASFSRFGRRFG
jgi:GlpG protein